MTGVEHTGPMFVMGKSYHYSQAGKRIDSGFVS